MSMWMHRLSRLAALLLLGLAVGARGQAPTLNGEPVRRIMAGDRLRVTVQEDPTLDSVYTVAGDGTVDLGYVGRLHLEELAIDEAADFVERKMEETFFKQATVSVEVSEFVEGAILVVGAVVQPGSVPFRGDQMLTLMEVITMSRGLTREAAGNEVRILRWKPGGGMGRQILTVDVQSMLETLDFSQDQFLRPRDIVFVPSLGASENRKEFLALGAVGQPGFHPFTEGLDVIRAVMRVGGINREGVWSAARILRPDQAGAYQVIPVDLGRLFGAAETSLNAPLQSGDIFFVPFAEQASRGQVYLLGEVARPGVVALGLGQEATLARLILTSGGFGKFANESKVRILRTAPDGTKQTLYVDVARILKAGSFEEDVPLQNGDVVIVAEKILGF
ncbi:MAG: SLBB domain-containing protein [Kiritimatiellae bacterium]|nr:SLBB domain-containing protein [Kiritimatiellia bacterium]